MPRYHSKKIAMLFLVPLLISFLLPTMFRLVKVFGVFRVMRNTPIATDAGFTLIRDTPHCEDMHFHEPSYQIFTAGEADEAVRFKWWPIVNNFELLKLPVSQAQGKLKVIDVKTLKAHDLELDGFSGPFYTHGMDIVDDPALPLGDAIYILVINHLPNKERRTFGSTSRVHKSHSVVEVFHHKVGSRTAQYIRRVWHPLITTPNDLVALSPSSFLVTNDHKIRQGYVKLLEDVNWLSKSANVAHIEFEVPPPANDKVEETTGVTGSIALNIHNANGIGHGRHQNEVIVISGTSGTAHIGNFTKDSHGNIALDIAYSVKVDSCLDNPSFFRDPYASPSHDVSSFVLTGLAKASKTILTVRNPKARQPGIVWRVKAPSDDTNGSRVDISELFQDDGNRLNSASTSLLVPLRAYQTEGQRQAWLFVTGFFASNIIAFKVSL